MGKVNPSVDQVMPDRVAVTKRKRFRKARVFIAWSEETKEAAGLIHQHLEDEHLSPWLSDQIESGAPFRTRIRETILGADLVIAVFPKEPSRWQIAEAGLAYFEQKLLPVTIDTAQDKTEVVEPFGELQAQKLSQSDIDRGSGESISALVEAVKDKLGEGAGVGAFVRTLRFVNKLFYLGVPLAGVLMVCALLVAAFVGTRAHDFDLHMWKAGHTVFGAIVYGGGAFVGLVFARAGTSTSFMERQFGFRVGRELFYVWMAVAVAQFFVGLTLLYKSIYAYTDLWVSFAMFSYLFAIMCWFGAYDRYRSSNEADREGKSCQAWTTLSFFGNLFLGLGLLLVTLVIVLMSLKRLPVT